MYTIGKIQFVMCYVITHSSNLQVCMCHAQIHLKYRQMVCRNSLLLYAHVHADMLMRDML